MDKRLLVLALGMFALGIDTFVVAGVLPEIAHTFDVDVAVAGQLTTLYAIAYALLAPTVAALAGNVPRKRLMLSGLGIFVLRLAEAGVTGINLEDGREPPELLARKIEALKSALKKAGLDVFVNARTDVYLAGLVDAAQRPEEVQHRAQRYQAAGADGLFVPAITALPEMRRIADATPLPLNVMAWEGLAPPEQLAASGVRRLSAGAGISARVWSEVRELSRRFLTDGRLGGSAMPFPELQRLFS